jgi:hypothetical protein
MLERIKLKLQMEHIKHAAIVIVLCGTNRSTETSKTVGKERSWRRGNGTEKEENEVFGEIFRPEGDA